MWHIPCPEFCFIDMTHQIVHTGRYGGVSVARTLSRVSFPRVTFSRKFDEFGLVGRDELKLVPDAPATPE